MKLREFQGEGHSHDCTEVPGIMWLHRQNCPLILILLSISLFLSVHTISLLKISWFVMSNMWATHLHTSMSRVCYGIPIWGHSHWSILRVSYIVSMVQRKCIPIFKIVTTVVHEGYRTHDCGPWRVSDPRLWSMKGIGPTIVVHEGYRTHDVCITSPDTFTTRPSHTLNNLIFVISFSVILHHFYFRINDFTGINPESRAGAFVGGTLRSWKTETPHNADKSCSAGVWHRGWYSHRGSTCRSAVWGGRVDAIYPGESEEEFVNWWSFN
jgi:hypothetical protein